jgi:hypothetical protein
VWMQDHCRSWSVSMVERKTRVREPRRIPSIHVGFLIGFA